MIMCVWWCLVVATSHISRVMWGVWGYGFVSVCVTRQRLHKQQNPPLKDDKMQSRYLSYYQYPSYRTCTSCKANLVFHAFDSRGYYKNSEEPVFQALEKARKQYIDKRTLLSDHLDTVVGLFILLDTSVPVFRKAGAVIRYLPIDTLIKLRENDFTANLLDKLVHYFQNHDWKNLLKALVDDRDYLLDKGCSQYSVVVKDEKENHDHDDYVVAALKETMKYEARYGRELSPTPNKRRRRSGGRGGRQAFRPSTPEHQILPICPLLANMR